MYLDFLHSTGFRELNFVCSYMNNKSKVIHEIGIRLIVGSEPGLKFVGNFNGSQLHNVLHCNSFCFPILDGIVLDLAHKPKKNQFRRFLSATSAPFGAQ